MTVYHYLCKDVTSLSLKNKLISNNCFLVFNVTTKNELLHLIRDKSLELIFEKKIEFPVDSKIIELWKKAYDVKGGSISLSKWVLESGFGSILLEKFGPNGEKLEMEYNDLVEGFLYSNEYYEANEQAKNTSNWKNVFKIMAEHALDSSDAMILNYGLSDKSFAGLISLDRDFNYCNETSDFEVVILDNYISDKLRDKLWRSKLTIIIDS